MSFRARIARTLRHRVLWIVAAAAVAPAIGASPVSTAVSLSVVFVLNGMALFLFPWVGHLLDMTQQQFGLWAAIAIHDTSSVVGAAAAYGTEALGLATVVKLTRALDRAGRVRGRPVARR